jgi:RNA recognition motif-containing protein
MVLPAVIAKRSCRLIIRNLPFKATEDLLMELFSKYGPIREVSVPLKEGDGVNKPVSTHCLPVPTVQPIPVYSRT